MTSRRSYKATVRDQPIEFEIEEADGEPYVYHFTPPKTYPMFAAVLNADQAEDDGAQNIRMTRMMFDWLGRGLADGEEQHLEDRLNSLDDPLDVDVLMEVFRDMLEETAGSPLAAPSASSQ